MDRKSANEALYQLGFKPQFVAADMEGFVFDIGDAMLAKVWIKKGYVEVWQLRSFYTQLREKRLPFATPQMHEVWQTYSGFAVSTEERLTGVPLKNILENEPDNEVLYRKGMAAVVSVVEALKTIGDIPVARKLALLDEPPLWPPRSSWGTVLGNLVTLRADRYKAVLERSVFNFERIVTRVVSLLNALSVPRVGVIHGDICPENVLVDEATVTPIGLLDFGFLTTVADPFFDVVISTLIFDMYSPHAQEMRESLRDTYFQRLGRRFGDIYPLYKAAYALATSNAYSEDGEDGHFRWCVGILNDEEMSTILS